MGGIFFPVPLEFISSLLYHPYWDSQAVPALVLLLSCSIYPFLVRDKSCNLILTQPHHHSEYFCSNPLLLGLSPELCLSWLNLLISDFTPILTSLSLHIHLAGTHTHRHTCFHQHEHTQIRAHSEAYTDTQVLTGTQICSHLKAYALMPIYIPI